MIIVCFLTRNNDGMLSKTEVLESQGVFVASQVRKGNEIFVDFFLIF